jgi:hypothetical protein
MLARTEDKVAEVRASGEKAVQTQTIRELAAYLDSLVAKGVDPDTPIQLDADFPTLIMRNDFLSVERWTEDEVILGNFCDTRC